MTRLVMGSVAERVLRQSPVPVLALRPFQGPETSPVKKEIKTILVPLDLGRTSLLVIPHAVEMVQRHEG